MDLIFIHGRAASGKLTIGRKLAALTGYPLFHNHLIVDAVGAVFPFGSEPFIDLRHRFWLQMFQEASRWDRPLIFTFAPEPSVPSTFVQDVRDGVAAHGGRVCFVRLDVSLDEQERRIENIDRGQFNKLRSLETLRQLRAQGWIDPAPPPADLIIDTAKVSAAEAAQDIVQHFRLARLATAHRQYDA